MRWEVSPDWLLVGPLFFTLMVFVDYGLPLRYYSVETEMAAVAVVSLYLPWVLVGGRSLFTRIGLRPLCLLAPMLWCILCVESERGMGVTAQMLALSPIFPLTLALALLGWVWTSGRRLWPLVFVGGVTCCGGAALAVVDLVILKARGGWWSPYDDPRPGQLAAQYPLTVDEAMAVAVPMLLASAAGVVVALVMERRGRRGAGVSTDT